MKSWCKFPEDGDNAKTCQSYTKMSLKHTATHNLQQTCVNEILV